MEIFSLITDPSDFSNVDLKQFNLKKSIIEILYKNGQHSAPEISKLLGVSVPTVTKLLVELIGSKFIEEVGTGLSIGGRKPTLYALRSESCFIVGIDFGWNSTRVGLFTIKNQQYSKTIVLPYGAYQEKDKGLTESIQTAKQLMEEHGIKENQLLGVGLAMAGLINSIDNINHTHFEDLGSELLTPFHQNFKVPIYLLNDSQAIALGEKHFGKAQGVKDAVCVNMNMGLGTGLILNGELYKGKSGFSGEFGHMKIRNNNKLCNCGKRGCAETEVSGSALVKNIKARIQAGDKTLLTEIAPNIEKINLLHIIKAVKKEDELAIHELSKMGAVLGEALSSLLHLLNPEKIILCGRLSITGDYLVNSVMNSLNVCTIKRIRQDIEIEVSDIVDKASLLGCVARVIEETFEPNK